MNTASTALADRLTPIHGRYLVRRVAAATQVGSIFIPDAARELPQRAVILKIGEEKKHFKEGVMALHPEISEGEEVLLHLYGGTQIEEDVLVVGPETILGVFNLRNELVPVGFNVLVEMDEREAQVGAIHVPEASRGVATSGTVVAVSYHHATEAKALRPALAKGEKLHITAQQGTHFKQAGKDLIIVDSRRIIATYESAE